MTQKELKNQYMEIVKTELWADDTEMIEYAKKKAAYIVELSDGALISLDRPEIKKDFCFGAGAYATATQDEVIEAEEQAEHARKSIDYFKNVNFKKIDEMIETLSGILSGDNSEVYAFINYYNLPETTLLRSFKVCRICGNPEYAPEMWRNLEKVKKLDADDIQRIIDGLQEVRKAFDKRLNTYLKRYGLRKINAWSYIRD